MATFKEKSQIKTGLINQPAKRSLRVDFPVNDKPLKLSHKKKFKLKNNSTNNESISLDFIAPVEGILKLRDGKDLFGARDYAHIAKLILDGEPMQSSREEMLCLSFFEIGLSLGADHAFKGLVKDRNIKAKGGSYSKFKKYEKEITMLLLRNIAKKELSQQKLIDKIEKIAGEAPKISTLSRWLDLLKNNLPLYKK